MRCAVCNKAISIRERRTDWTDKGGHKHSFCVAHDDDATIDRWCDEWEASVSQRGRSNDDGTDDNPPAPQHSGPRLALRRPGGGMGGVVAGVDSAVAVADDSCTLSLSPDATNHREQRTMSNTTTAAPAPSAITYETPFGTYQTWELAAAACERCDLSAVECIRIVRE